MDFDVYDVRCDYAVFGYYFYDNTFNFYRDRSVTGTACLDSCRVDNIPDDFYESYKDKKADGEGVEFYELRKSGL